MKSIIITLALAGSLAGCASSRSSEQKNEAQAAWAAAQVGIAECGTKRQQKAIKTHTQYATCLNDAEEAIRTTYPNKDLLSLRQTARLSLAQKVDGGQLSATDADLEFAKLTAQIETEERNRAATALSAVAQMRSANAQADMASAARRPVSCNTQQWGDFRRTSCW